MRPSQDIHLHWSLRGQAAATLFLLLFAAPPAAAAETAEPSLGDALKGGKVSLHLRYRYEDVRVDGAPDHARASTLRTALGYRTRPYKGFSFQIEAENVAVIGNELYNNRGAGSLANNVSGRPVVADPAVTEINQALLRYRGDRWQVAAGRQEILLGDVRFVGNVGWRQSHQSFDAFRVDNSSLGGLRLTYAYVDRAHRIFGGSQELAAHLLNAGFDLQNYGKFTFYGYLLDYQDPGAAALSTSTVGLEFTGKRRLGGGERSLLYEVEYARQADHADNPDNVDAAYSSLMLGVSLPGLTIQLAREELGGKPGEGSFKTPLATLHKFNGWADIFLSTPPLGLEDISLQLDGKLGEVAWLVRHHDFGSASEGLSYGQELDLQLLYTCPKGVLLGLKGALYDADSYASDTDKWMVWSAYRF